jgi:hypothetical protein
MQEVFVSKVDDFAEGDRRIVFHAGTEFGVFHWPSTIYDLPFLSETAKRNILGGNAIRLFNLKLGADKFAGVKHTA